MPQPDIKQYVAPEQFITVHNAFLHAAQIMEELFQEALREAGPIPEGITFKRIADETIFEYTRGNPEHEKWCEHFAHVFIQSDAKIEKSLEFTPTATPVRITLPPLVSL